ncbi:LLM class F420-dependent oxidoreductase [Amycolatopsis sp. NPDC049159]|uniref:LLM class F420-dependent oxidoreductase n=1 Tax=Amycolatopsis sp. NPDC049159 TaxID=3157210 RepID=UPI0033C39FDD
MKIGLCAFPTDYGIAPGALAVAAEERGFESLFFCDHTHIPVSRRTPYPPGGELPRMYLRSLDLFGALTAAAAVTATLRVGSGVCLVVQRDPIVTAKQVATLDLLSGGRFLFGVGAGWNREEMAHHGTDPRTRMRLLGERVRAMRAIWTEDEAEFHGEFVDFDPLWSWPKPRRVPPVLVGGMGPGVEDRILAWGDGWLAQNVTADTIDAFAARLGRLRERAPVPVTLFNASADPALLARYAELGLERVLLLVPDAGADVVLPHLDHLAPLVA